MIRKVALTGPESTGKSMLSMQLAGHYHTAWVPEFARSYLSGLGRPYVETDILAIARGQVAQETALMQEANRILFCDTELLVTKIWSEVKYNRCHPWIEDGYRQQHYDLYLLCNIDLPWEFDPLREHPGMRDRLFRMYYNALTLKGVNFVVVSGSGTERLNHAVDAVESHKETWYG